MENKKLGLIPLIIFNLVSTMFYFSLILATRGIPGGRDRQENGPVKSMGKPLDLYALARRSHRSEIRESDRAKGRSRQCGSTRDPNYY